MGKPLMIQLDDDRRLENLKKSLQAKTKVEVLRRALDTLEGQVQRVHRIEVWKKAARLVAKESAKVNKEFQRHSLIKK